MKLESNTTYVPRNMSLLHPVKAVVMSVDSDEPAWALQEGYCLNEGYDTEHRYQVLFIRIDAGDSLGAFWTDLGPSEDFKITVEDMTYPVPPYHQLALFEHAVDELQFYANRDRADEFAVQMLHNQTKESDIVPRYQRIVEEDLKIIKNQSQFGTTGFTQRGGYSKSYAKEQTRG